MLKKLQVLLNETNILSFEEEKEFKSLKNLYRRYDEYHEPISKEEEKRFFELKRKKEPGVQFEPMRDGSVIQKLRHSLGL